MTADSRFGSGSSRRRALLGGTRRPHAHRRLHWRVPVRPASRTPKAAWTIGRRRLGRRCLGGDLSLQWTRAAPEDGRSSEGCAIRSPTGRMRCLAPERTTLSESTTSLVGEADPRTPSTSREITTSTICCELVCVRVRTGVASTAATISRVSMAHETTDHTALELAAESYGGARSSQTVAPVTSTFRRASTRLGGRAGRREGDATTRVGH